MHVCFSKWLFRFCNCLHKYLSSVLSNVHCCAVLVCTTLYEAVKIEGKRKRERGMLERGEKRREDRGEKIEERREGREMREKREKYIYNIETMEVHTSESSQRWYNASNSESVMVLLRRHSSTANIFCMPVYVQISIRMTRIHMTYIACLDL